MAKECGDDDEAIARHLTEYIMDFAPCPIRCPIGDISTEATPPYGFVFEEPPGMKRASKLLNIDISSKTVYN